MWLTRNNQSNNRNKSPICFCNKPFMSLYKKIQDFFLITLIVEKSFYEMKKLVKMAPILFNKIWEMVY